MRILAVISHNWCLGYEEPHCRLSRASPTVRRSGGGEMAIEHLVVASVDATQFAKTQKTEKQARARAVSAHLAEPGSLPFPLESTRGEAYAVPDRLSHGPHAAWSTSQAIQLRSPLWPPVSFFGDSLVFLSPRRLPKRRRFTSASTASSYAVCDDLFSAGAEWSGGNALAVRRETNSFHAARDV
jgi:hypothetical protein